MNEEIDNTFLPEAPVSITVKGYYQGFSVLITKRNAEGKVELDKIISAIDNMVEKGFKPSWNEDTNKKTTPKIEEVKDEIVAMCPIHNVPMEQRTWTDPQGKVKTWWSHSKNEDGVWYNCSGKGWKENIKK
jgi:negative regulator of genetic competence, sporulation and motility